MTRRSTGVDSVTARVYRRDSGVFAVSGSMTFDSVVDLWRDAESLFADLAHIEIDLDEVTHTDSAGLALLVEWLREIKSRQGTVSFHNLPAQMLAIARTSNLEHILGGA